MENQTQQQPLQQQEQPPAPNPIEIDKNRIVNLLNTIPKKLIEHKRTLIIFGVVFAIFIVLLVLLNLITKSVKNIVKPNIVASPTPITNNDNSNTQNTSAVSGELAPVEINLLNLKKDIENLDLNQSRLTPPDINFAIEFDSKK